MKKYSTVFMGTPVFATAALAALIEHPQIDLIAVVTQPDRKKGRKQILTSPPVKVFAAEYNIPVYQPEKIGDIYNQLSQFPIDVIITCAFGQFIPDKILNLAKINSLNLHASLLPKLRGGAPIHKAIMYGETETGISLMKMIKKMDGGEVYYQNKVKIEVDETASSLHDKLMLLTTDMINNHLILTLENQYCPWNQDESKVTYAYNITRAEEHLNWENNLEIIDRHIRSLYAQPLSYTRCENVNFKILTAQKDDKFLINKDRLLKNGTIVEINKFGIRVKVTDGYIYLTKIQREGKNPVPGASYLHHEDKVIKVGSVFE